MSDYDAWIDRIIREARERGEFDNLPGRGQPLNLDDNRCEDPSWRLANHLLKNAGFAPEWIESDCEIRDALAGARQTLLRSRDWRAGELGALGERRDLAAQRERDWISEEWSRAVRRFAEAIGAINKQIVLFNLKAPLPRLQRAKLDAAQEVERLGQED